MPSLRPATGRPRALGARPARRDPGPAGADDRRVVGRRGAAPVGLGRRAHRPAQRPARGVRAAGVAGQPAAPRSLLHPRRGPARRSRPCARRRCASPADRAAALAARRSRRRHRRRLRRLARRRRPARRGHGVGRARHAVRAHRARPARRPLGAPRRPVARRRPRRARRGDAADLPARRRRPDHGRRHPRRDGRRRRPPPPRRPPTGGRTCRPAATPATAAARAVFRALAVARSADRRPRRRPPRRGRRARRPLRPPPPAAARRAGRRCPASASSSPTTPTTTGRSASSSSTRSTPGAGARPRTCGTPPRWPSSWPAATSTSASSRPSSASWPRPLAGCVDVAADLATRPRAGVARARPSRTPSGSSSRRRPSSIASASTSIGPERLVRAGVAGARHGDAGAAVRPPGAASGARPSSSGGWSSPTTTARPPSPPPSWPAPSAAGATLLHTGRRWVRIDPAALRRARRRLDEHQRDHARVDAVTLLRLAGDGEVDVAGAGADRRRGRPTLLAGLPDERLAEEHEDRRRSSASCARTSAAAWAGCGSSTASASAAAWPTTWASARRPPRSPTCSTRPGPHLVVCPLSVVHNWQAEAARFTPALRVVVHHGADRGAGRRRARRRRPRRHDLRPAAARPRAPRRRRRGRRSSLDEAQMIKNPATHAAKAAAGAAAPARSWPSPARRWRTASPSCGRSSTPSTPGCSAAASASATASASRSSATATATPRPACGASPSRSCCAARKADRSLVPDLPGQDRADRLGRADPRAGRAVPARRRPAARRRRGDDGHEAPRPRARRAHPAQADLQPPGPRARRRLPPRRPLGQAGPLRRARRRAARRRRAGARVHPVPARWASCCGATPPSASTCACRSSTAACRGPAGTRWSPTSRPALGPPLLLVSLKAGGTGLNLTAASQVIHYDRWWNPAVEDQATDRAWRIGQGRTVVVHKLVCEGTVEERIAALIDQKRALADAVVGSGESWLSELSTAELRELVALERSADDPAAARSIGPNPPGRLPAAMLRALAAELSDPGPVRPGQGLRPRRRGRRHRDRAGRGAGDDPGLAVRAVRGHRVRRPERRPRQPRSA